MSRVFRKPLSIDLAAVPAVNEKSDCIAKRSQTTREAAGLTTQSSQVMTQFGVIALDGIGLALI